MLNYSIRAFPILLLAAAASCAHTQAPGADPARLEGVGALPSARQLAWHSLEYYAFVHFNMNTFTGAEWGTGKENPDLFNPENLDCRQWARICKEAGMKGIILTAKHHDGFCLWPSKYTQHSVASSKWKGGRGDVLKELSEACREYDLKFGIYISPWDRSCPLYGDSPKYNEYFKNQLREVLTNYGPVFEVWFDGACGEGPNGKKQVYDWPGFIQVVRECQPEAVIFSDAGPDVRWVGNESGRGDGTSWCTLNRDLFYPGTPLYEQLTKGHEHGSHWVPSECDVSIRPGWYYHSEQDDQVKSVERLMEIYYDSVGSNSSLLLNIPVDRRGLIHENDAKRLLEFRDARNAIFLRALDGFTRVDGENSVTLTWPNIILFDHVTLAEDIALGQRVQTFTIEARVDGEWKWIGGGTTIGNRRIVRTVPAPTRELRIRFDRAKAAPKIREIAVHASVNTKRLFIQMNEANWIKPVQTLVAPSPGINYQYYENSSATQASPRARTLVREGITQTFGSPVEKPGPDIDINYAGFLMIPSDGIYEFRVSGADAATVKLHSTYQFGFHTPSQGIGSNSAAFALRAGPHPIHIQTFMKAWNPFWKMECRVAGRDWATIPPEMLTH